MAAPLAHTHTHQVSGRHCTLAHDDEATPRTDHRCRWAIWDGHAEHDSVTNEWTCTCRSTNGVLVNGVRVKHARLRHGDRITLGGGRSAKFGRMPSSKAVASPYVFEVVLPPGRTDNASNDCLY